MMCTLELSAYICNLLAVGSDNWASSCVAKLAAVRTACMPAAGLVSALATVPAAEVAKAKTWGKSFCQGVAAAESLSVSLAPSAAFLLRCEPLEDDFVLDSCLSSACPGAS